MLILCSLFIIPGFWIRTTRGINGTISAYVQKEVEMLLDGPTYNKQEHPYKTQGVPVDVAINVYISSISSISDITMDYEVNFYLRQEWIDPRITFKNLSIFNESVYMDHTITNKMWIPDTYISNEKTSGKVHDVTIPNIMLRLQPDGSVLYSQRISTKVTCDMDLYRYPMDEQECKLQFEIFGHVLNDVIISWKAMKDPVQTKNTWMLPEFALSNYTIHSCDEEYITGHFGCVYVLFSLKRVLAYYIIQVYLPSVLIVILSWVSFWIDRHSAPARVSLGLLTVVTITTQASGISARLPRVSYVKAIDIWMFTCGLFVFSAFLEYSFVNTLARQFKQNQKKEAKKKRLATSRGHNENNPNINVEEISNPYINEDCHRDAAVSVNNSMRLKRNIRSRRECFDQSIRDTNIRTESTRNRLWKWGHKLRSNKALFVDDLSRIAFPGLFILFNAVYWYWFYAVK